MVRAVTKVRADVFELPNERMEPDAVRRSSAYR